MGQRSAVRQSNIIRGMYRFVVIALVALIGFGAPLVSAAQSQTLRGTSYTSDVNDQTVTWNDNWTATLQGDDEFATMVMLEGQIMIYSVMFIHDPLVGLDASAVYHSLSGVLTTSFDSEPTQSVEWEGDNGSFYGIHVVPLSGIDFALYLRVDPSESSSSGPTMQLAAAPVRAFPTSLDSMQEELTLNGEPVLEGDDGEEIIAMLEEDASANEAPADASDQEEAAPSSSTSDRGRLPASIHDPSLTQTSELSEYVSAANDFTVTYNTNWQNMEANDATVGEFSLSDSDTNRTVVAFTGRSTTETNREAFFEDIVARESRHEGFVGSHISDDRLLIATWSADNELSVLEYVFVDDDTLVTVMVTISSASPETEIDNVRTITLDGVEILRDWDEVWPAD